MPIDISDYIDLREKTAALGGVLPTGFAPLPDNIGAVSSPSDLRISGEASTVLTLLRNANLPVEKFTFPGVKPQFIHNKSFEWGAVLFVSGSLLSENQALVSVALGVVANYLTDYFKGDPTKKVKLSVVTERTSDRTFKMLTYEGPADGLKSLEDAIYRIADE